MSPLDVFWTRCEGPIVFGVNDCCMTVADVILAAGGPDLMAEYRGRYSTRIGFVRAFRKAGYATLHDASTATLKAHGKMVDAPRDWDVSVVTWLDNGQRTTSPAFYSGGFWCLRSERGMVASKGSPEMIWRVIHA